MMKNIVRINIVREYPINKDNFILSVDGTYGITAGENDFWKSCKRLLSTWGFKILNYKIGLVETPYGKSGLNMCFSTSQKVVLLALYLKMKEPDKEFYLNMTEVSGDMYDELFSAVKGYSNIVLVTKALVGEKVDETIGFFVNDCYVKNYHNLCAFYSDIHKNRGVHNENRI